jgi:hypothetical protein
MLKTLLRQIILEECIDTLFNNIKHNFTPLNEDLIIDLKIIKENNSSITYIIHVKLIKNNSFYKFKSPNIYFYFKTSYIKDHMQYLERLTKHSFIRDTEYLQLDILQYLKKTMIPC